jgi:signal transduction histidine kinase
MEPATADERRQTEWFYRALVGRSPVVMLVFDLDGHWRWSSPAAVRLHGPGTPDPDALATLVHPEDTPLIRKLFTAALAGPPTETPAPLAPHAPLPDLTGGSQPGGAKTVEVRLRPAEGTDEDWRVYALTVQNLADEPAIGGIVVYAIDITRAWDAERRELVHTARLETLIGSLRVGILVEDQDQRAVLANTGLAAVLGIDVDPDQLIGARTSEVLSPGELFADPDVVQAETARLIAGGRPATGAEFALTDGRVIVRDYAPIEADGVTVGHVWVLRDVTAEAMIRRGLEERNRALAEVATLKTEFVAAASHELRTPLTSILTFSQMLAEEPDSDADQRQVAFEAIARNANRTLKIVDDLLTLAGLEGGTLPLALRAVHLPDLVREAIDGFADVAERAGVTVSLVGDVTGPMLRVDPARFRQSVEALLSVVSAHAHGNRIDVEVSFSAARWTVRVGSPTALHVGDHLFTTGDRGAGNALTFLIARAIVSRHGGQLVTPTTGDSDAFAISLPVRPNLPEGDG